MRNESEQKALRETLEMKQSLLERNFILFCNKDGSFETYVKREGEKASELTVMKGNEKNQILLRPHQVRSGTLMLKTE